jgi:hypothetical protein
MLVSRQPQAAIGMGKDGRTGGSKGGVAVGVVEMPVGVDQPPRRLRKRGSDGAFDLRDTRAKSAVDDRADRRSGNRRDVSSGSAEDEDAAPDLRG